MGQVRAPAPPTLWRRTPNGIVQIFTGHSTTTDPYYTWTTGPTAVLSTYADNSPVTFAAQTGRCIDINGGTAVQLWDCNGTSAQKWTPLVRSQRHPEK